MLVKLCDMRAYMCARFMNRVVLSPIGDNVVPQKCPTYGIPGAEYSLESFVWFYSGVRLFKPRGRAVGFYCSHTQIQVAADRSM